MSDILSLFKEASKKYNVDGLANNLVKNVKGLKVVPERLRLYSDRIQFDRALEYNKKQYSNVAVEKSGNEFIVNINGTVYVYIYMVNTFQTGYEKYNSIFLGVNYKTNSFNRFEVLEHNKSGEVEYFVYIDNKSPRCLRFGFVGNWSGNDKLVFGAVEDSNYFS